MIIKQKNGTILEMTTKEFSELGNVLGSAVEVEEVARGKAEVTIGFKVGDKVEVIGKSTYHNDKYTGKQGVVTLVFSIGGIRVDIIGTGERFFRPSSLKPIEEETEEVLSQVNVKEGEYFVITDNNIDHRFAIGEVVKAKSYTDSKVFKAEHMDELGGWFVYYTDVRRATDAEIAEATKPKEVKFEVGDVVESGGLFAKIFDDFDSDNEYRVGFFKNGSFTYLDESEIRHATDEEKSHLQTLIGREKDEYKVGDLVELLISNNCGYRGCAGFIFEIDGTSGTRMHLKDNGNKTDKDDTYVRTAQLKLITPVEWRHDFI